MTPNPKPDRRAQIIQVATELFKVRGYHGTRMDDVADTIKLNKGTLYHYYDSKATILFEIYMKAIGESMATVPTDKDASPTELLTRHIQQSLLLIASSRSQAAVYFQESPFLDEWLGADQVKQIREREREYSDNIRDIIKRGIAEGQFLDVDPTLATLGIIGMTAWFYRWYDPKDRHSPEEVAGEFARMVLAGLLKDRSDADAIPRPRPAPIRRRRA